MKLTLKCECGKDMKWIRDWELEKIGGYAFDCECGQKIIAPQNNPKIKVWEKYKIKINQQHADEFESLLKELKLEYKITPYAKELIIWGVFIHNQEDIEKIKNLPYVTHFGIMPVIKA